MDDRKIVLITGIYVAAAIIVAVVILALCGPLPDSPPYLSSPVNGVNAGEKRT